LLCAIPWIGTLVTSILFIEAIDIWYRSDICSLNALHHDPQHHDSDQHIVCIRL
jgi:hypothetical protein